MPVAGLLYTTIWEPSMKAYQALSWRQYMKTWVPGFVIATQLTIMSVKSLEDKAHSFPYSVTCSLTGQARRYREATLAQFSECNRAILRSTTINCSLSGSTVVTALAQARRGRGKWGEGAQSPMCTS